MPSWSASSACAWLELTEAPRYILKVSYLAAIGITTFDSPVACVAWCLTLVPDSSQISVAAQLDLIVTTYPAYSDMHCMMHPQAQFVSSCSTTIPWDRFRAHQVSSNVSKLIPIKTLKRPTVTLKMA